MGRYGHTWAHGAYLIPHLPPACTKNSWWPRSLYCGRRTFAGSPETVGQETENWKPFSLQPIHALLRFPDVKEARIVTHCYGNRYCKCHRKLPSPPSTMKSFSISGPSGAWDQGGGGVSHTTNFSKLVTLKQEIFFPLRNMCVWTYSICIYAIYILKYHKLYIYIINYTTYF